MLSMVTDNRIRRGSYMDSNKYLSSLEYFLNKMQSSDDTFTNEVQDAIKDLCEILRVGAVKTMFQSNHYGPHVDPSTIYYFYKNDNCSEDNSIEFRYATLTDNTALYIIFPLKGQPEWSVEEKNRIKSICDMLFIFNGRTRMIELSKKLAFYDPEFKVYNLKFFHRFLASLIREDKIFGYYAVNFNLKQLNMINNRIGRNNCTKIMQRYIDLINSKLSEEEALCRLGGDNFAAIIKTENFPVVSKIFLGVNIDAPDICGESVRMSSSVGLYKISEQPKYAITSSEIMDRIHIAMQKAKRSAKAQIIEFDQELFEMQKRASAINAAFDDAIANEEFIVNYQPKVSLKGYTISGAEALCRWIHNEKVVPPGLFIPILEQSNDICKLDFYMLRKVCSDLRRWIDAGIKPVRISVNLSRMHLKNPLLVTQVCSIVDKYELPHDLIELELTETINPVEFKELQKAINGLRQNGFATSVDDFGTGYSSLNLIKEIPWNVLKLDKSLLPACGSENVWQDRILFKYIVAMAKEMGLECVAEGVETMEQLQLLSENNCEMAQGFFFDKPMNVKDFEDKLRDRVYTI